MTRTPRLSFGLVVLTALIAACSAPTVPASHGPSPSRSIPPVASPSADPNPSASPSPDTSSAPTPFPSAKPKVWSPPRLVLGGDCTGLTATVDATGRYHAAASCDGGIRYATSSDGVTWTTTSIVPGIDVHELGPQLAVDGSTIHLAFTRLAPDDGGCGDDGLRELGVIHQSRQLPDGAWSGQDMVGQQADALESFRVADGVIHATVRATDGTFYVSEAGATGARIRIPDAVTTSLRVGDDGKARIAYATGKQLRLARVDGDRLTTASLVTTDDTNVMNPLLVLGPGNRAFVSWTQNRDEGGGCIDIGPGPLDGTFFGSDAGGSWASERVSDAVGPTSLTLDVTTGKAYVLVDDGSVLRYFTSNGTGTWTATEVPGSRDMHSAQIRLNPVTGAIAVFALDFDGIHIVVNS